MERAGTRTGLHPPVPGGTHLGPKGAAELGIRGAQDEVVAGPAIKADLERITCAHGERGRQWGAVCGKGAWEGSLEPLRKTQPYNGPYSALRGRSLHFGHRYGLER